MSDAELLDAAKGLNWFLMLAAGGRAAMNSFLSRPEERARILAQALRDYGKEKGP